MRWHRPALTSKRSNRSPHRVGQKQVAVFIENFPVLFGPQTFAVDGVERRKIGVAGRPATERMRVRYKFSEVTDSGCFLVSGNFVFCALCETFVSFASSASSASSVFSVPEPEDLLEVSIAQPDRNARAKLKRAALTGSHGAL